MSDRTIHRGGKVGRLVGIKLEGCDESGGVDGTGY